MDEKLEFKINQFEGPLDLLLHLIDKNKFNIFDIPIVEITEQYLDYLNRMQEENLDVMSEFLVMAATLISIKAKMLLPREEKEEEEEEDPRAELVRRLLEYKICGFNRDLRLLPHTLQYNIVGFRLDTACIHNRKIII